MKLVTFLIALVLGVVGGVALLKRLKAADELPVEGYDEVALAPVPPLQESL